MPSDDLPDTPAQPAARTVGAEAALIALALSILYLATLAGSHNEGEDGIGYLLPIRNGHASTIFNPYHLIYNWLGWFVYHGALTFGYDGGPIGPVQALNAVTGAIGIALLWAFLRSVVPGRLVAGGACGILAFSYGYWGYSVDVEVYVLSTVLLLVSLMLAHRAAMRPSAGAFLLLGLANGVAVLGHNTNVLFAAVAAVALLIAWRTLPLRDVIRCGLAYAAGAAAVVLGSYAIAIPVVGLDSPRAFWDWLTADAQNGQWGYFTKTSGIKVFVGLGRALIAGHFALALGPVRDFADRAFKDKSLREEYFLVRNYSSVLATLLLAVSAAVVGLLAVAASRWLSRPKLDPAARTLAQLCAAWIVTYTVFFSWWEPANLEFWIATWLPIAILLVLPFASPQPPRWSRLAPMLIGGAVAGLFAVNLAGSVLPQRHAADDYWRVRATWYAQNTQQSDLVFTNGYIYSEYLRYFGKGTVIDVPFDITSPLGFENTLAEMQRRIDAAPQSRVLFSSELLYPGDDEYSHCHEPECTIGETVRGAYLDKLRLISDAPLERVWELQR